MREGSKHRGTNLVRQVFGGTLAQQGRGYYVALELLAIIWGTRAAKRPLLIASDTDPVIRYRRRTHDFARRLLAEPERLTADDRRRLGPGADRVLGALLQGLVVPVPGQRVLNTMPTCHFFPYVGELVHHDAVWRGPRLARKVELARNSYRGAGALAYRILGDDPDTDRLSRVREGLGRLVNEDGGPLGTLAGELAARDAESDSDEEWFEDDEGTEAITLQSPWVEVLRSGVANIVAREDLARARRVDALVHWVPFCIAMHQLSRARMFLGEDPSAAVAFECGARRPPIRTIARDHATRAVTTITRALERVADETPLDAGESDTRGWMKGPRTFFTTTLGIVGAFNAMAGSRHFALGAALLESIVLATVIDDIALDDFVEDVLHRRLHMIVDGDAAAQAGLLVRVDRDEFKSNCVALAATLRDLGLLREFSDMTRLVSTRGT